MQTIWNTKYIIHLVDQLLERWMQFLLTINDRAVKHLYDVNEFQTRYGCAVIARITHSLQGQRQAPSSSFQLLFGRSTVSLVVKEEGIQFCGQDGQDGEERDQECLHD